jgi:hypothetical protein
MLFGEKKLKVFSAVIMAGFSLNFSKKKGWVDPPD